MRLTRILPAVATALVTSACGLSFQSLPMGRSVDGPSYRITVVFADAAHLPLGGQVRIGQATVGRVHAMSAENFQARVALDISQDVRLPVGTTARLELTSALGEEYVLLQPPARAGGGDLTDGATIEAVDTSRGPDIEDTLAALGAVLNGSGLDQMKTIVSELNTALGGREQEVRDLLHRLGDLLASVDAHSGDLDSLLGSLNSFAARTAANRPLLDAALTRITPAIEVLLGQRDQFTRLLTDVASLGKAANGLLDQTGTALTQQLRQLQPALDALTVFNDRLGGTLSALHTFAGLFGQAIPGDYLNLDGTLDVPTSIGGAGALLSGGTR